jgi:hypothetical protein
LESFITQTKTELQKLKENDTDQWDSEKIKKIEEDLWNIEKEYSWLKDSFNNELNSLSAEVKNWEKEKWWLWRQRDALKDKQEWKDNTWKNVIRALSWVWLVWWTIWLGKKIFWKKEKKDKKWKLRTKIEEIKNKLKG